MTISNTVNVSAIPVSQDDPTQTAWGVPLASQYVFVLAHGTAAAETFDAADLPEAVRTLMATYGRGVSVALGGGGDTAVGSAWGDVFRAGDGVNYIDGGANGGTGPDGNPARDVLNVFAASAAAVDALQVTALGADAGGADGAAWAAGYRVKVSNGSETDYLKDVEQVNVFRIDAGNAYVKTIRLAPEVYVIGAADPGLAASMHHAWVQGTDGGDAFDASTLPTAAQALMAQHGRGVYVELGGGDDTAVGSGYGDDFTMGAGTNYADGGANGGSTPWGGKPQDVLHVVVADQAAAAAVQVVQLVAGMNGADAQAFANGYTHKVGAGAETDYVKGIERITVQVAQPGGGSTFAR
ncbi:hypothetical protein, partial [uncultured Massilia sp.]|uniref:hypothetical protein n=1 Tax=uncultured Massilia sp. TaxID=169973 RepID=UPI0025D860BE